MQSKNQVVIFCISIFEKPEQTVQSNRSAELVRKKRPPSYLCVAAWTSILYSLLLKCSGRVLCENGQYLVEVSNLYMSKKMRCQTVRPKIKSI